MSKFAEKLQRIHKGSAPVLGFRKTDEEPLPQMLVIADLATSGVKTYKVAAGADAVIVGSEILNEETFEQLSASMDNTPIGMLLEGIKQEEASKLDFSRLDFVVFDVKTPLATLRKQKIGKVLKIEPSMDAGLIRAIN